MPVNSKVQVIVPSLGRYIIRPNSASSICYLVSGFIVAFLAFSAPYAIIGGWTRFHPRESTQSQRGWLMAWLVCGQIFGIILGAALHELEGNVALWGVVVSWVLCGGVPAIVGFIVVGQMLAVFPSCVLGV
jgi:hypothetical protein